MAREVDIVLTLNAAGVVTGGKAGAAGVKGIEQQAKKTEKALGRMGRRGKKAGDDIGRTMRSGRAGALSLNRIVQDMPFGFIAIQNNVTELAASFTVMKQNGLSGAEAIKSILSQFKGPGGFLFIISAAVALITAFGGKMVEAFNKGKTTAKELTEALETLLTIQRDLNKFQIAAEDIEAKLLRTREEIANATEKTRKFTVLLAGATVSVTDAEREALKVDLDRLNGLKALEKELEKQLETSKALAIEQEVLVVVGADLVAKEEKLTKAAKAQVRALGELLEVERDLKKVRITGVDVSASIARAQAEIARLRKVKFVTGQLRQDQTKRLEGIKLLLKQLRDEEKITGDLTLAQELLVLVGGELIDTEKDVKTAFEQVQESVKQLRADLRSLKGAGIESLVALEVEARKLGGQLATIQRLVQAITDPQKVGVEPGFLTFGFADLLKEDADEQKKALFLSTIQLKDFSDATIEEMRRLQKEMEESAGKINLALASIANAEVIEETLGNFAGAFGDIAGVRQEAIERELDRENAALENSLDERTQRLIEAGVSEVEARRRANQQINSLQEQNAKQAADAINRQFRIQKAFAVAEAVVATFNAANKALASAPPPFSFALMASTIAVGLANVAAILAARPGGSPTGGGARGGTAVGASSTPVGLGGIRVQNRGFTIGATGAALGARAPMDLRIEVIEKDLFTINVLLKNADGVRAQVGSI